MKRSNMHEGLCDRAKPHIYLLCWYEKKTDFKVWCAKSNFYSIQKHGSSPLHALDEFRKAAYK